jgi:hypothetical protein
MTPINFFAATDLAVIDVNPEFADYSNPRGEIVGHAAYVYAESARGDRRRVYVTSALLERDALEPADRLARALNNRLAAGKLPVAFDRWEDARPAYGSDAYLNYGQADDLAIELREAQEEWF